MLDVRWLERHSTASVAVLTDAFATQAEFFAVNRGCAKLARVFVKHPMLGLKEEDISLKADAVYEPILQAISQEGAMARHGASPDESSERGGDPTDFEECET